MDPITVILTIVVVGLIIGMIALVNKKPKFGYKQAKAALAEPGVEDHLPGVRAAIKALGAINIVRQQATKLIARAKAAIQKAREIIANTNKATTDSDVNIKKQIAEIRAEAERKIKEIETGHAQMSTDAKATVDAQTMIIRRCEAELARITEIVDKLG